MRLCADVAPLSFPTSARCNVAQLHAARELASGALQSALAPWVSNGAWAWSW